jgi:hypothetical protein
MSYDEREEQRKIVRCESADVVINDATYLQEAINNSDITFDQALMALLITELRELNERPYS